MGTGIGRSERIVEKFWISRQGQIVAVPIDHQTQALLILRDGGEEIGPTREDAIKAESILLDRDWIRVQVYENAGLGLHGRKKALNSKGRKILERVPSPKRIYLLVHPSGVLLHYAGRRTWALDWTKIADQSSCVSFVGNGGLR